MNSLGILRIPKSVEIAGLDTYGQEAMVVEEQEIMAAEAAAKGS